MSEGETVILIFSSLIALVSWIVWYARTLRATRLGAPVGARAPLALAPVICPILLLVILRQFAATDVRSDGAYLFFYMILGAAWVGLWRPFAAWLGVSARDDVAERGNGGASLALLGALIGMTLCYAGGNIGNGPGWWVVVFSAFLSTGTFFLLWLTLEIGSRVSETITVDRDTSAGLRLGGFLIAIGLVLGRGVAGDWVSADETWKDFVAYGYPTIVLTCVAIGIEFVARPTPARPRRSMVLFGVGPALGYLAAAAAYVVQKGWWTGGAA